MAESDWDGSSSRSKEGDPPSDETQDIEEDEETYDHVQPALLKSWARLVPIDNRFNTIELREAESTIGREDVRGDKRVSRVHCMIWRDESGNVHIKNLSSYGTIVGDRLLQKDEDSILSSGSEISLRSNTPGFPVYVFQSLQVLQSQKRKRIVEGAKSVDSFKCSICLNMWHDAVSVAPCLHSFCNACFSDWYRQSKSKSRTCKCPQCRVPVISVGRNHTLCNLVEEILVDDPSLRRPKEDAERMEKIALIKSDFITLAEGEASVNSTEGFMSSDAEANDEDQDIIICRQCERWAHLNDLPTNTFRCTPRTNHLMCTACGMPLPERPDLDIAQKCITCHKVFCDAYWRSQNLSVGPIGCTSGAKLQSMNYREVLDIPRGTFQGNTTEQDITRRYMAEHRLSITGLMQEWSRKLDSGEVDRPTFTQEPFSAHSAICDNCANFVVQHLFYKFRLSIPKSELPLDAAGRDDCWYGYKCRTQLHKESHARRLNHVCEPARRAI